VSYQAETPFDDIEGSHEYVAMLAAALEEARRDVETEVAAAHRESADRRKQALLLVSYNLAKLNFHVTGRRLEKAANGPTAKPSANLIGEPPLPGVICVCRQR